MAAVYLIHLEKPFGHAQHYIGWAERLDARISHHKAGSGALFLRKVNEAGIPWTVVRTWSNQTRTFERWLKNLKKAKLICPVCNPTTYQKNGIGKA